MIVQLKTRLLSVRTCETQIFPELTQFWTFRNQKSKVSQTSPWITLLICKRDTFYPESVPYIFYTQILLPMLYQQHCIFYFLSLFVLEEIMLDDDTDFLDLSAGSTTSAFTFWARLISRST